MCAYVCVCVCVCKCACQAVQKCHDAGELVIDTKENGQKVYGMPIWTVSKGRRVTNTVKYEAFKKLDQKQVQDYQSAFHQVFADVCADMDISDMPKTVQNKMPPIQIKEIPTMDDATKQQHKLVSSCYCVSLCSWQCFINLINEVATCECLLLLPEVYSAESKLLHIQTELNKIMDTGKLEGQMRTMILSSSKLVNQAVLFCMSAECVLCVSAESLLMNTFALCTEACEKYYSVYQTHKMPDGSACLSACSCSCMHLHDVIHDYIFVLVHVHVIAAGTITAAAIIDMLKKDSKEAPMLLVLLMC